MAITKIQSESLNLSDTYDFTGTVTGAGGTNTPAFHARGYGTQAVSANTWTKLTFATEEFDTNSAFASDRFTVPSGQDGKYLFTTGSTYNMDNGSGAQDIVIAIYKNGSSYNNYRLGSYDDTAQISNCTVSGIINLEAADYIEVYGFYDSGTNRSFYDTRFFHGHKILT